MDDCQRIVDGRRCHIFGGDGADRCIICGMENHAANEIPDTASLFYEAGGTDGTRLVLFETTDWNGDFSPWPAKAAFGNEAFTGKAPATLRWLTSSLIPYLESGKFLSENAEKYIVGYSLSGLFALWAFLEENVFDGAASCSGSLWFPGWMEYMRNHERNRDGMVYLSLGSKEEKTKNALMASVGENTRESYDRLKNSPRITRAALEWNRGGHFSNPKERLVRGMLWLQQSAGADRNPEGGGCS